MTDDERAEILITTRLLRACAPLPWLATFLIAVAVFSLQREASIPLVISIAAGVVALIYGIRSVFDARLFEDALAEAFTMQQLDRSLGLTKPGRSWSDRCRGARRLPGIAAAAILVQLIALVVAAGKHLPG